MTAIALIASAMVMAMSGCTFNLFDPVDSPTGDTQLISAARACFDRGDFAGAKAYYDQLTTNQDVKNSEEAYLLAAQGGVPMAAFVTAFGNKLSEPGNGLTKLANYVVLNGTPGAVSRASILSGYMQANSVVDTKVRGLAHFVTAMGLLGEVLAEGATGSTFAATGFVTDGSGCVANQASCVSSPGPCDALSGDKFGGATTCTPLAQNGGNFSQDNFNSYTGFTGSTPTLCMVDAALQAIVGAVEELALSSSATGSFATNLTNGQAEAGLTTVNTAAGSPCYRAALVTEGVGFTQ